MSLVTKLSCVCCGAEIREGQADTCPKCGMDEGILDVHFDLGGAAETLTLPELARRPQSMWRYRELLPIDDEVGPELRHIGWTPLIEVPRLARQLGVARLRVKDEGRSASGSFKDRASAIAVTRARQQGAAEVACASTGNAASSLAHCAAAVGLPANIFVSNIVPQGKLTQLLAYGARVFKIDGTYAQAYELCIEACRHFGWYNRNAAINPYLVEGKKSGGLELAEQCRDDPPDWVVCSVGDGCSIAGIHKGLMQMNHLGLISWQARMLGVQAHGVAPIAAAFETGVLDRERGGATYADSINVPVPRNWRKAVDAVRHSRGAFVTATDEDIQEAVRWTGRFAGVFAEPAAAAAVAGLWQARRQNVISPAADVVVFLTGNGLKDLDGATRAVGPPHLIAPSLKEVIDVVQRGN